MIMTGLHFKVAKIHMQLVRFAVIPEVSLFFFRVAKTLAIHVDCT